MKAILGDLIPSYGLYDVERYINGHFVWAKGEFGLKGMSNSSFYAVRMCYYGDEGALEIRTETGSKTEFPLARGWNTYPLDLSAAQGDEMHLRVNPVIPVQTDTRDLGVMIRRFQCLEGPEAYERLKLAQDNKKLNDEEFLQGKVVLDSYPSLLRLATHTQRNMVPRCAYCDWETAKNDESDSDFTFSIDTLADMGSFFQRAASIGELRHGEPMLSAEFSSLIRLLHYWGKPISLASNAQVMGPRAREAMLGMDVELYVSIDAATDDGYRRYRNDQLEEVLENLRALCREKKEHRNLPNVIVTSIAMKSNRSDIEPFLALMNEVGVDGVRIMNLDPYSRLMDRVETHNGYRFVYRDEVLPYHELEQVVDGARASAAKKSLPLLAVTQFSCEHGPGGLPVCSEPWKTINPLKRGLIVCGFNKATTVAKWGERQGRSVEQFLLDTWNGPMYREIRSALAAGELHPICKQPNNCPIAKRLNGAEVYWARSAAAIGIAETVAAVPMVVTIVYWTL